MRKPIFAFALLIPLCASAQTWRFAVSGDSRNCGDVVMPAIAAGAKADRAAFYWHLGDFRALYLIDEDMSRVAARPYNFLTYFSAAWPDFIRNQVAPFAPLPVFLGIGNHELVQKTRGDYVSQFADWLTRPEIQQQRLADDPNDHLVRPYYHWIQGGVDFITMDNASNDQFDNAQVAWIKRVLDNDANDDRVKAVIVGMHAALPHSLGCDHSMNEWTQGEYSGDIVYHHLLEFREKTKKNVYVLASHSHFLLRDVYDSPYWRAHGGVLPGIIIGTAGAIRYRLPDTALAFPAERAKTDVYGYVIATVDANGGIRFDFRQIDRAAIPQDIMTRYGADFVDWCFDQNKDLNPRSSEPCARADAPCGPTIRPR
jgi:calcineurin-like phosphoesterase family protein